jgi:hypothetical protein
MDDVVFTAGEADIDLFPTLHDQEKRSAPCTRPQRGWVESRSWRYRNRHSEIFVLGEDVNEAATELMKTITPARIEGWPHSEPKDWANESFAIAEQADEILHSTGRVL